MTNEPKKSVRVSAAILRRNGRVLVCQRRSDQQHPGKWEFPGGKIEAGESAAECLRREIAEELGVEAEIGRLIAHLQHNYPGGPSVELWFYAVDEVRGEITNRVFADMRWVTPAELASIDLLEADRPLIEMIGDS